jgi:hypothetical protein
MFEKVFARHNVTTLLARCSEFRHVSVFFTLNHCLQVKVSSLGVGEVSALANIFSFSFYRFLPDKTLAWLLCGLLA